MLIAAFATVAVLTLSPHPLHAARSKPFPAASARRAAASQPPLLPGELFSARAKRRMASFLRMRLIEMRLRGLERAAAVVEHRLSLDALLHSP